MSDMKVHYTSEKQTWETPQDFFDLLDSEFHFDVDVCAEHETAKCNTYYTVGDDGLSEEWSGICWMNPPYGRKIGKWLKKAYESSQAHGATVVCLIPARTDTAWWHDYVMKASEIRFVRGRLKFGGVTNSAPFPNAVVVFRPAAAMMGFEVKTQERK
jgi:phage N-6-adenine-methyltransferase